MRVVIVGAGVMGLSLARSLLKRGHEPVLVDQGPIPNPLASSMDEHRLIRFAYGTEHGYAAMIAAALAAWDRLWADLGVRHLAVTGQMITGPADDPWVSGSIRSLERLGVEFERLDGAAAAARFPVLDPERVPFACHTPSGGVLFAARIAAGLATWLRQQGVSMIEQTPVIEVDLARATAHLADGRLLGGERLVVTAGAWLPRLVPGMAASVTPSRQTVVYVEPPPAVAAAWNEGPMMSDRDGAEAGVFYVVPPRDGAGLKFGDHSFSMGGDPDGPREPDPRAVADLLALSHRRLRAASDYRLVSSRTCFYTVTSDERFLARAEGPSLVVSPCSGHGFKFAALIGERTAAHLDDEDDLPTYQNWLAGREHAADA
jgi:glycine/D-amino acid oxidase-like deaminating enzyme